MPAAIYPKQLELYMESRQKGLPQETAAAKAGISRRTAHRIDHGQHRPQKGRPHDWKTRKVTLGIDHLDRH